MYFEAVFQPLNDTDYNSEVSDFTGKKWLFRRAGFWKRAPAKDKNAFTCPTRPWAAYPNAI